MNKTLIEKIEMMGKLEKDWNGYGANEFDKATIDSAKLIANLLTNNTFKVFPTNDSEIQFEIENDEAYLEFDVSGNSIIDFYFENKVLTKK